VQTSPMGTAVRGVAELPLPPPSIERAMEAMGRLGEARAPGVRLPPASVGCCWELLLAALETNGDMDDSAAQQRTRQYC
jgi:hypothetical protein